MDGSNILRTYDGGYTWNRVDDDDFSKYFINDFTITDDGELWAVGAGPGKGVIIKTANFGESWSVEVDTLNYPLNAVSIKDSLIVAVGDNGLIVKSKNNGLTWVDNKEEIITSKYNLYQNYPNPFNPSTTIKYEIPGQARNDNINVTLKIYDILGREIATIVNEKQKPGNYEITWDGSDQTSGVYFYKLNAGNYLEDKKDVIDKINLSE